MFAFAHFVALLVLFGAIRSQTMRPKGLSPQIPDLHRGPPQGTILTSPKSFVIRDLINSDKIVIFSATNCQECLDVKELFDKFNAKYTVIEVDTRNDGKDIQDYIEAVTGDRSVPRVVIKGGFVGGSSKITEFYKNGELKTLLEKISGTESTSPKVDLNSPKAAEVKDLIKRDKVVIFSKTFCPYSKAAKAVFDELKQKYTAIELDKRDDGPEIQSILGELTGAKTVPRVFIDGKFVGGSSDVKELHQKGELQTLLEKVQRSITKRSVDLTSPKSLEVKDLIKSDKVVIFSKTYCRFSKAAKEVFNNLNQKYTAVELDIREDGPEIQDILAEITGARTVPRVFINGNFVGGSSDVKALAEKGDLQTVLKTT